MINISPSNIFLEMLLLEKYMQNCQAFFGRSECEWVNTYASGVHTQTDKFNQFIIYTQSSQTT